MGSVGECPDEFVAAVEAEVDGAEATDGDGARRARFELRRAEPDDGRRFFEQLPEAFLRTRKADAFFLGPLGAALLFLAPRRRRWRRSFFGWEPFRRRAGAFLTRALFTRAEARTTRDRGELARGRCDLGRSFALLAGCRARAAGRGSGGALLLGFLAGADGASRSGSRRWGARWDGVVVAPSGVALGVDGAALGASPERARVDAEAPGCFSGAVRARTLKASLRRCRSRRERSARGPCFLRGPNGLLPSSCHPTLAPAVFRAPSDQRALRRKRCVSMRRGGNEASMGPGGRGTASDGSSDRAVSVILAPARTVTARRVFRLPGMLTFDAMTFEAMTCEA